jgi:type II secretory pathway component PulJ
MRPAERGAVLLEVVIALTILLAAGVSLVSLLSASLASEAALARREAEMHDLDRLLTAMSLLTRTDLDRRLGRHPVGPLVAEVQRPQPTLYRLAVRRGDGQALVTVVYRPDPVRP